MMHSLNIEGMVDGGKQGEFQRKTFLSSIIGIWAGFSFLNQALLHISCLYFKKLFLPRPHGKNDIGQIHKGRIVHGE
jgi:hypothetical protein